MKTKYFKFLCVLVAVIIAFSSLPLVTSAVDVSNVQVFNVPIAQPQVSDNSFYAEVLYKPTSVYAVAILYFTVHNFTSDSSSSVYDVTSYFSVSSLSIRVRGELSAYGDPDLRSYVSINGFVFNSTGYSKYYDSVSSAGDYKTENIDISLKDIQSVRVYGDCDFSSDFLVGSNFIVNYSSDSLIVDKMDTIIDLLESGGSSSGSSGSTGSPGYDPEVLNTIVALLESINNSINKEDPTNDGYKSPDVSNSSIDYGFLKYSFPVLETTGGKIIGGASLVAPYLDNDLFANLPSPYSSYCMGATLQRFNNIKFENGLTFSAYLSLNFDRPVSSANFQLDIAYANNLELEISSYGSDNLAPWIRRDNGDYIYFMISNITQPVKIKFKFKTNFSSSYAGDVIPFCLSLKSFTYVPTTDSTSIITGKLDTIISKLDGLDNILSENGGDSSSTPAAGNLDSFNDYMEEIEDSYKVDEETVSSTFESAEEFLEVSDMSKATVGLTNMYDRFSSDNSAYISFLVTALGLGLAFWIIGRRST